MNLINQINGFLAKSIGLLNAALAVVLVLFGLVLGLVLACPFIGPLAFVAGPLVGVALAISVCGLLAVLINIRDLLAESLVQRRPLDEQRDRSEDSRS